MSRKKGDRLQQEHGQTPAKSPPLTGSAEFDKLIASIWAGTAGPMPGGPESMSYDESLASVSWKKIRRRVLRRDRRVCLRCRGKASQVHHLSYADAVLRGLADDQLVSLCAGCHDFVEFDDAGRRRGESEKPAALRAPLDFRLSLADDHDG